MPGRQHRYKGATEWFNV